VRGPNGRFCTRGNPGVVVVRGPERKSRRGASPRPGETLGARRRSLIRSPRSRCKAHDASPCFRQERDANGGGEAARKREAGRGAGETLKDETPGTVLAGNCGDTGEGETRRGRRNGEGGTERARQTRARNEASASRRSGLHRVVVGGAPNLRRGARKS